MLDVSYIFQERVKKDTICVIDKNSSRVFNQQDFQQFKIITSYHQ